MRKHKVNLVSQYLENISRKALVKYQNIIKKYVRGRHGVYALYRNNKLYYVGLASNLKNRLNHHLHDRHAKAWDSFSVYFTVGGEHLHELETLLLRIIDKKGNRQKGKFGKADNLNRKVRSDFKKALNEELDEIFSKQSKPKIEKNVIKKSRKGRNPVLASYFSKKMQIRFKSKGKLFIAHVRSDGTIKFARESADADILKDKIFTSPSVAAAVALRRKSNNGWRTWKYERAPGDWVLIDELRK